MTRIRLFLKGVFPGNESRICALARLLRYTLAIFSYQLRLRVVLHAKFADFLGQALKRYLVSDLNYINK